jgi:23S rRNA pseudouridine2457 synthase
MSLSSSGYSLRALCGKKKSKCTTITFTKKSRTKLFMHPLPHRYFIINKPYDMVSQFVSTHDVRLLGELDFDFPPGTHAVGRLDNHSEGLLILTTNKKLTRLLFSSTVPHERTYLVQVSNIVSAENLERLRKGVTIKIRTGGIYTTSPCRLSVVEDPEALYKLDSRLTAWPPFTWVLMTITEGKYHQVRKMIGAIRHRCKRLIRVSIEDLHLGELEQGGVKEIAEAEIFKLLKINNQ